MKKLFLSIATIALMSCTIVTNEPANTTTDNSDKGDDKTPTEYVSDLPSGFARGADISWYTEQEADGVKFYNDDNQERDCMLLLRANGMNAVRLRVFVDHSNGYCNVDDVRVKAMDAQRLGLRIMIDFHYSDFFADPSRQDMPASWEYAKYNTEYLAVELEAHTKLVLQWLKSDGVTNVEWVQVGNEVTNGMLWPTAQLWNDDGDIEGGWTRFAQFINTGYDAVKSIYPDAKVIVHIDNAYENRNWYYRKLRQNGGKFDMIGLSHYPQTNSSLSWSDMNTQAANNIKLLYNEFKCPIMICEVGTKSSNLNTALEVLTDFRKKVCTQSFCAGAFYWEPQVFNNWKPKEYTKLGWGAYDMGCFTYNGHVSEALKYFLHE